MVSICCCSDVIQVFTCILQGKEWGKSGKGEKLPLYCIYQTDKCHDTNCKTQLELSEASLLEPPFSLNHLSGDAQRETKGKQ